ncbi:hypothetical protein NPIL_557801 [Nephila pilipes]|uniref:Uncharacterized protein n=1 Tax=Nephila pilipes TaxID=299642 RepID=A0A8X6PBN1_NEPPI|nr:hypothetical protein NPIL_557801 [Nephila pilipes]
MSGDISPGRITQGVKAIPLCSAKSSLDLIENDGDCGFIFLNDGTSTHLSYSYNTSDALDVAIVCPNIFSKCDWTVLENIGSDNLPVLIRIEERHRVFQERKYFWNIKKANRESFIFSIDFENQPQVEKHYAIQDFDGTISKNDIEAENLLGAHDQKISNLDFSETYRLVKRRASSIVHGCRSKTDFAIPIFSKDIGMYKLLAALHDTDLRKSSGLDDKILVCMIDNLGQNARHMLLDIINISWSSERLPRYWKRATVIPI